MGRLVFSNANLVDGESPAAPHSTVVVEGERITTVVRGDPARASDAPAPRPGDRAVDLGGRTLMPGLFSCHFHATFADVGALPEPCLGLGRTPAHTALVAGRNARTALECGVTSAICSSTAWSIDASLEQAIEAGVTPGPRLLPCSHELVTLGDTPDLGSRAHQMELGARAVIRPFSGPDEARRAVREEIARGARIVKFSASDGHTAGPTQERLSLAPDELRALVETAQQRGALTRAHTASKASILACARAGVDILDHVDRIDAECVEAVLAAGSAVAPTLLYMARFLELMENADPSQVPLGGSIEHFERTVRSAREDYDQLCRTLPEVNAAGVAILTGDDYGVAFLPHGDYGKELELYVKHVGISARDVVRWATRHGARAMGRGDDLGHVAEGKLADLLVVDGDPLADITCLADPAKILAVMKGGALHRDALGGQGG